MSLLIRPLSIPKLCVRRVDLLRLAVCLLLFVTLSIHQPILAQVSKSDSLALASLINQSHEQLLKHNYSEAIRIAHAVLDKSTQLNFQWGLINSNLMIGQCQKSLSNFSASLNHYLQALAEIQKQNDTPTLLWTNLKIGELFHEWGVPEKALPYYASALSLEADKSSEQASLLLERMAECYLALNKKDQSLEKYFQLLDIVRKNNEADQTARVLEKIALIYSLSNDLENSLKYNLQLLEINRQGYDAVSIAVRLNIIGNHYKDLNNPDKALEYYQSALAMNRKVSQSQENDNSIVTNLINIGSIYQSRGDNRNSIRSFNEALEIKKKRGTPVEIAVMHNYVASLYLSQGNYSQAEEHTKISISLLSDSDNKQLLARNYKRLSEIYEKGNNYQKALESYQAYSILKDSLLYREQLAQEKEKLKEFVIETTEKEAKLSLIDHEMQALNLRTEKEIAEREKQAIALLLKETEFQNVSLQKEQLEQARAVQYLQLQRGEIEKQKREQEILFLEQKRDLQTVELERNELQAIERQKEITFKNTTLALQQSQLERVSIQQQYLLYTAILFFALILLILVGYIIKQRDNKKLQLQYDEIARQKGEIESINKSLVELNEEKNNLIGIVAHDLKSPLNQISGMLEIIKLTTKDQPSEQQVYTASIEQSTNRLKKMITKILDVSAIESKTLNISLETINVQELLNDIINRFAEMAAKKNITMVRQFASNTPALVSDVGYLSEVLENLLSNAVKYSPIGKEITVKLSNTPKHVRIEFIDQGQGISEKDMKNLFGKYQKLSAKPTAGEDSTGLGLSIVKKYVEALNGKVWCESEEGKGANFVVEFPVSP